MAYASKALNETQKRYAQIESEMLAIVFGCERFHQYVFANPKVTVETDHKPLLAIFNKSLNSCPPRLQRMLIKLQQYSFDLVYKSGKELYIADTLSRSYDLTDNTNLELDDSEIEAHVNLVQEYQNVSPVNVTKLKDLTSEDTESHKIH